MNSHLMLLLAEIFTLVGLFTIFTIYFCSPARAQSMRSTALPASTTAAEAVYRQAHFYRDVLHESSRAMACYGQLATTYGSAYYPHKTAARSERLALAAQLDRANSSKILYRILNFFARLAGSFPAGILLFSALIRTLLAPLSIRQIREAKKMQDLQPEIKKLQDRHKNDVAGLSTSMRKLQTDNGIHPYLGALLGLVQAIVFIGVYNTVVLYQYHLIGAHFLWIGAPIALRHSTVLAPTLCDPDLLLGVLYAAVLFATQRLTARFAPSSASTPAIAMVIGPVSAFVMVWSMRSPAAFVIYWCISTALGAVVECFARRRIAGNLSA